MTITTKTDKMTLIDIMNAVKQDLIESNYPSVSSAYDNVCGKLYNALTAYYKTPQGKQHHKRSPHRNAPVNVLVESILQTMFNAIQEEVNAFFNE